jgi:hypothetical protein
MADQALWFDVLGTCRCGKPATGKLRGPHNENYGVYCQKCAIARLHKARGERAREPGKTADAAP